MASVYLYRTTSIPSDVTFRYEITTIENADITMDQPVSPMALPQEDANENILVKMEGNTQSVNISWKVIGSSTAILKKASTVLTTGVIEDDADGTSSYGSWTDIGYVESGDVVSALLTSFQGISLNDRYFIKFPNVKGIMEGFITRMYFSISGDSPVIWSGNISFTVGNVISMYDADSSSEPRNISASQVGSTGSTSDNPKTKIRLRWQAPSDSASAITFYKVYMKEVDKPFTLIEEFADSGLDGAVSGDSSYKERAVTTGLPYNAVSGDTYYFKISAVNGTGNDKIEGIKSNIIVEEFP